MRTSETPAVIPDGIFQRLFEVERTEGFLLAGILILRRPPTVELSGKEQKQLARFIKAISAEPGDNAAGAAFPSLFAVVSAPGQDPVASDGGEDRQCR